MQLEFDSSRTFVQMFLNFRIFEGALLNENIFFGCESNVFFFFFQEAIEIAGYTGKISICMDTAASEFWNKELARYDLDFKSPKGDVNDKSRYVSYLVFY